MSSSRGRRALRAIRALPRLLAAAPLALALATAGLLARRRVPATPPRPQQGWSRGVTVLIPERGTPDLLEATLAALHSACAMVDEPVQVIIIVNGADESNYAALCTKYAACEWHFDSRPLGFNGAVAAGLAHARHDWTYLLNSDMRLEPDALQKILPERRTWVFAIASQIFFSDPGQRREETGWSDFLANPDRPEVYERDPGENARIVRGSLYAGGGSALFRTRELCTYVADSVDYRPFYWEDADWGVRAWIDGWEVLFCPASRAWHQHRGTVRRFYEPAEIDRIIARNALLFDLRRAWSARRAGTLMRTVIGADALSFRDLLGVGLARRVLRARLATLRARQRGLRFESLALDRWYEAATSAAVAVARRRPRVLLVSPFALFPPAHGGARRIAELLAHLRDDVDFVLLSDEGSMYGADAEAWLRGIRAARFVEGRGDRAGETALSLTQRLERHAWPGLREELDRLIARYDPDIVQVEFMELAGLAAYRSGHASWLLALHDVTLTGDENAVADDAAQIAALRRFDAVTFCSPEDGALLPRDLDTTLIGNGATDRRADYHPSPQAPRLLFMGPFRYAQNRDGIVEFIATVWPALRVRFPELELTILGGPESAQAARAESGLLQAGIDLISTFVDPAPYLAKCTLTINPQRSIRGSSIKLIESLLAGRACVSTADGARGFADAGLGGLALAPTIAAMAAPIAQLLGDADERHRRESADAARLDAFTWSAVASRQLALYHRLAEGLASR